MSFYDHKVMQDLRLERWGSPAGLRNWELEREAARLRAGIPAGRKQKQPGTLMRLRAYIKASASKPACR
jgi:hypothetical protein